jgi:1,4-dihydroxy-2-naphthoate octaprenyltransferase
MKNKILFIFSLISFVVVVFYTMELMEAVTNFANKHGDLIRSADEKIIKYIEIDF